MEKAYGIDNPCKTATRPKVEKKRRRYFSPPEIVRIIKACRFEQDLPLILALLDSACRVGELAGLKPENIGDSWIDVKGKTGERRYRLDPAICRKLKQMAGGPGLPVFRNRSGGEANVDSLKRRVTRVVKEAGITGSKLGPHTLRHSSASLVAQKTQSALVVKALLQHDDINTSMLYIHDAEGFIQQNVSPLKLIMDEASVYNGDSAVPEHKQLRMGDAVNGEVIDSVALVPVEAEVTEGEIDDLDEWFPEIKDGVEVRPLLKTEDLKLIRWCFINCIRNGEAGIAEGKMRGLVKRMLRKVRVAVV
jgi:hypothetical protein